MLELRDEIKRLYAAYDVIFLPVIKFVLALFTFTGINQLLGYMTQLNNLYVVIILAVLCAILPWNGILILGMLLVLLHCFALGLEVGAFALALYLVMAIFYFRLVPGDALALLLTPVTCSFYMPAVVPVALGLLRGPVSTLSAMFGVISWYFLKLVSESVAVMKQNSDLSSLEVMKEMLNQLLQNRELLVSLIATAAVVLLVNLIRKMGFSRCWEAAVGIGCGVYVGICILGSFLFETDADPVALLIGAAVAFVISLILEFFVYSVDYKGSQYLQFEDDANYYYVKVIPKRLSSRAEAEKAEAYAEEE